MYTYSLVVQEWLQQGRSGENTHLPLLPCIVSYLYKLLYLRNSGPGEVLHWYESVSEVWECIVRRNLLWRQSDQMVYTLVNQEPYLPTNIIRVCIGVY